MLRSVRSVTSIRRDVIPHRKLDIAVCLIALLLCQARVWGVALPSGGVREVAGPASSSVSQSAKGQWLWSYLHGFAKTRPRIGSGLANRQELDDFGNVLLYHLQMNFQNDGASSQSEGDEGGKTVPTTGRTAITNEALAPAPYGMSSHGASWHLASNDAPVAFLPWQNVHAPPIL